MTITPEELERAVLGSFTTHEAVRAAETAGICDDSFQVEEHVQAWQYILQRAQRGTVPTRGDVARATGVQLPGDVVDTETFLEELIRRTQARQARRVLSTTVPNLSADPMATVRELISGLNDVGHGYVGHTHFWDRDARERFERIMRRRDAHERGEVIGIPTGLQIFDEAGNGWQPGELVGILGQLNVGKSWLLLYFAAVAYFRAGKKVLVLSPESTIDDIEMRMDTLIGRMMGYELSNDAIRRGAIDPELYGRFIVELEELGNERLIVRDSGDRGSFQLDDVLGHAREHRPDLLCIDGFHLIEGVGKSWENMKAAAMQIKGLAQFQGMAVIAGSQVQREALIAQDDTPEIGQAAYGLGLMETANRVITLAERRGDQYQRIFKVPKNRDGRKVTKRQYLRFDADLGDIGMLNADFDLDTGEVALQ